MARALRILVAGGWYHVAARGNNQQAVFLADRDRERVLGLVAELSERFSGGGVRVCADGRPLPSDPADAGGQPGRRGAVGERELQQGV